MSFSSSPSILTQFRGADLNSRLLPLQKQSRSFVWGWSVQKLFDFIIFNRNSGLKKKKTVFLNNYLTCDFR